jgi:hypothetical protein
LVIASGTVLEKLMRHLVLTCLIPLALAACATPEQRAAAVQRDVDDMIRVYGPGCDRLGYRADTDEWRACVLRLAHRDDLQRRALTTTNCIGHRGFFSCSSF